VVIEEAHDQLLAVHRRNRRHARVDRAALDDERIAPVLRDATVGDVHAGEQFDPADERRVEVRRDRVGGPQDAVDAHPHAAAALGRGFDVHVARAQTDGPAQVRVDRANRGRIGLVRIRGIRGMGKSRRSKRRHVHTLRENATCRRRKPRVAERRYFHESANVA
jgi:hypothetical protein